MEVHLIRVSNIEIKRNFEDSGAKISAQLIETISIPTICDRAPAPSKTLLFHIRKGTGTIKNDHNTIGHNQAQLKYDCLKHHLGSQNSRRNRVLD